MEHHAGTRRFDARAAFVALWLAMLLLKAAVAARLPLFVDEAFYWQESRHLAWAYSDLPGLSAWLIRLGNAIAGDGVLGVRMASLAIAALLPWLVVRIAMREVEPREAWQAGMLALLLPLAGTLGLLALPDAAMALATLLCIDAAARMLRGVSYGASLQLAAGLAIGALSHYRFAAVIAVGALALLWLPQGRRALRDPRTLIALAFGVAAWAPLLAWNLENAEAGLRFQLVDRHPWAWHPDGIQFVGIQALLATPLLFVAFLVAAARGLRDPSQGRRLLALCGGLLVAGFFVLGFFADTERVSFHWPLPGLFALLPLVPAVLARWPRGWRIATWATAVAGLAAVLGYYAFVSTPRWRAEVADDKWYPSNFAGWDVLADAVRDELARMPDGARLVADNFKIGAELGFELGDPRITVLPHPLNRAHGRAPQLRLWGLEVDARDDLGDAPVLLVVGVDDVKFSELLDHYRRLCARFGPLPHPRVVDVDGVGSRYLLLSLPASGPDVAGAGAGDSRCVTPAIAHVDTPAAGEPVDRRFRVQGWAIKDGAGVREVRITLGGRVVATAEYGRDNRWVADFFRGRSTDPNHPRVGFEAEVDAGDLPPGRHLLGLVVVDAEGEERWVAAPVVLR